MDIPPPTRFLHVMLRVMDLQKSVQFYRRFFGLKVLRETEYPEGRFTLAFLGYGSESGETVIELTCNWERKYYERGNAYGHLAFAVADIHGFCKRLRDAGVPVIRAPGPLKFAGESPEVIAFVEDPDGYSVEIIESNSQVA